MNDRPNERPIERPIDRPGDRPGDRPLAAPEPVDDATIAALVRDAADGWRMPPQRLGAPTWSDRVEGRAGRRRPTGGWSRRVLGAASTVVLATVAVALIAVWLTLPRSPGDTAGGAPAPSAPDDGGATAPGGAASERPSPNPTATPFPALTVFGEALPPTRLLVSSDGATTVLDMATGETGEPIASASEADDQVVLFDGRGLCLCGVYSARDGADHLALEIRWVGADGMVERVVPVGEYSGWAGPTASGSTWRGVGARGTLTPDGNRFIVGWTSRQLSAWRSGIDVVDVATGRLTPGVTLPDLPLLSDGSLSAAGTAPDASGEDVLAWAPAVQISPSGLRIVATQYATIREQVAGSSRHAGTLDAEGGPIRLTTMARGAGRLGNDDCFFPDSESFADNDTYSGLCSTGSGIVFRRVALDGAPIGDTNLSDLQVSGSGFWPSGGPIDSATGVGYYWSAFNRTLVKLDRASGEILGQVVLPAPTAGAGGGLLDALAVLGRRVGSFLAPTALAKIYLDPSSVLSPDGTRLYLLGTTASDPVDGGAGSTGIWVVDTASLAVVDHWEPTADFMSIAVSRDGAFVYAAGMPDVAADGTRAAHQVSVTVFDGADGTVRAIAGQLGRQWLTIRGVLTP